MATVGDELMKARASRFTRLIGQVDNAAHLPGWLRPTAGESRWPAGLAVLVAIGLQLSMPQDLAFSPKWLLPGIELGLFAALMIANPIRIDRESMVLRIFAIGLVAVASVAVGWSAARLAYRLVVGHFTDAEPLLINGGT